MERNIKFGTAALLCLAAGAALRAQNNMETADSVIKLLALNSKQSERLDRLYDNFARTRLEQEAKLAAWQDEFKQTQSQIQPDERNAARLTRDIKGAEARIATAFLQARAEGLKVLTPEQRIKIETLDPKAARDDKYRQLLLLKVDDIWQVTVDADTARRLLNATAYAARSPNRYRYFGAPYDFSTYGYGLGGHHFYGGHNHAINHDHHHDSHPWHAHHDHHGPGTPHTGRGHVGHR